MSNGQRGSDGSPNPIEEGLLSVSKLGRSLEARVSLRYVERPKPVKRTPDGPNPAVETTDG